MKHLILMSMVALVVTGCGTMGDNKVGLTPAKETETPVKDVKISTDFTDQGVKIYYTTTGSLDRIEVFGRAPAWRGNVELIAEADAKDKLVKFVHGESVNSERRNKIITRTLDRARDNTLNRFKTVDGTASFDAREVNRELDKEDQGLPGAGEGDNSEKRDHSNTSRRIADRVERGLVDATTTIVAQGRLVGVRKIRDQVVQDGRTYIAVYQWSPRDQDTSDFIRGRMR